MKKLHCLAFALISALLSIQLCAAPIQNPVWQIKPFTPDPSSGQHTPFINSVAITGDGTKVVGGTFYHNYGTTQSALEGNAPTTAATNDGQTGTWGTYCYDKTGKLLWKNEFAGWQGVYWVDISTNGAYAAAGGWFSSTPSYAGFVRVFNASTGQQLAHFPTAKRVNQVAFSANNAWLISAAESLTLYKITNGTCVISDQVKLASSSDYVVTAEISATGTIVVCATYGGQLLAFSNTGGKLKAIGAYTYPTGTSCHMVQVAASGKTFVAGGPSGLVYYFTLADIAAGKPTVSYQTESTGSVYGVAISDDGTRFVGLVNKSTAGIAYFVGSDGKLLWKSALQHNPNCASLNLAKGMLAIADGHPDGCPGTFYLFDTATGNLRWTFTAGNMSWPIGISANGTGIVAGSDDSNIYFFKP